MTLAVADRLAVSDLVHLYASAVDDRRFADVIELFTETAELRLPDPPRSLEPVVRAPCSSSARRPGPGRMLPQSILCVMAPGASGNI